MLDVLTSNYGFHNLFGAMYLQMYWLVAAGEKHIVRCRYCSRLINLTARSPGQTVLQRRLSAAALSEYEKVAPTEKITVLHSSDLF